MLPVTFSLDIEDHRPDASFPVRYPDVTREVFAFLRKHNIRGTMFFVGQIAQECPDLVREAVADGHEIALHAWEHRPLVEVPPAQFREETRHGKELLEELSGQEVIGFRSPTYSITPLSFYVTDILPELGFRYSSSVIGTKTPLYWFPGAPSTPFQWPSGLIELPLVTAGIKSVAVPFIGGVYLRILPMPFVRWGLQRLSPKAVPWIYCHPYDFDAEAPFWVVPDSGKWGSKLLWKNRDQTFDRVQQVLGTAPGGPLQERLPNVSTLPVFPT